MSHGGFGWVRRSHRPRISLTAGGVGEGVAKTPQIVPEPRGEDDRQDALGYKERSNCMLIYPLSNLSLGSHATMPTMRLKPWERRRCAVACYDCRKRRQRCDGAWPCSQCVVRGTQSYCQYFRPSAAARDESSRSIPKSSSSFSGRLMPREMPYPQRTTSASSPRIDPLSVNMQKRVGVFVGSTANLCVLQKARELVSRAVGPCSFVDEPKVDDILDEIPSARPNPCENAGPARPLKLEASESKLLVRWYLYATKGLLDLFDEPQLYRWVALWLEKPIEEEGPRDAVCYLVCAIGAQACPGNMNTLAELLFHRGRTLVAVEAMENLDLFAVQSYALITMYLLGASRWNAAFMSLGTAVRGAHALGLHRDEVSVSLDPQDRDACEQIWRVLRVLDLFLSLMLGRPLSTSSSGCQPERAKYSASIDLCIICESVYNDVYNGRQISGERQAQISQHYRRWTTEFRNGLSTDRISPTVSLNTDDAYQQPDIGLYHLKQAYYVSIMVWTRSTLFEVVLAAGQSNCPRNAQPNHVLSSTIERDRLHADACIISALRCMDLLQGLLAADHLPKQLPFIVNSIFLSALVLGVALFGDFDYVYPIGNYLQLAQKLLQLFNKHDAMADKYLTILRNLSAACDEYVQKRRNIRLKSLDPVIKELFRVPPDNIDTSALPEPPQEDLNLRSADLGLFSQTAVNEQVASFSSTQDGYWQDIMAGIGLSEATVRDSVELESFECSGPPDGLTENYSESLTDSAFHALFPGLSSHGDYNGLPYYEAPALDLSGLVFSEGGLQSSIQVL